MPIIGPIFWPPQPSTTTPPPPTGGGTTTPPPAPATGGNMPLDLEHVQLVENPLVSTVSAANTQLLRSNPNRVWWKIYNRGGGDLVLQYGISAPQSQGVPIENNTGYAMSSREFDREAVGYPVYATPVSGAVSVWVVELVAQP